MTRPVLLLLSPDSAHRFDAYLEEILLTEGYNGYEKRRLTQDEAPPDLRDYPLAIISSGAAAKLCAQTVLDYVTQGGRAVLIQPPRDWAPSLGLAPQGQAYTVARDAYLRVSAEHPWMAEFPAPDLQVPGEAHVHALQGAEALAFIAGQRGQASVFPAVSLHHLGQGAVVTFAYDLAETTVLLHQGRPEKSSTGPDPDANRDGKFTPDDAFEGMRDFELRHVPQADVHQDLLVRVLRGLMVGQAPVPRLWHFPNAAPALVFIDGDGDAMVWEDLEWVVRETTQTGTKYTLYLMTPQIEAFEPSKVAALRAQGYEFGVHPWANLQPDLDTWRACVRDIVSLFQDRFGFAPRALRAHSCVFPGWDENPEILREHGLRLDTDFGAGYRFVSGYLNGSALPVKFISRDGRVIDCYSQSTVQTEDGSCTPKSILPPMTEDEALALGAQLLQDCARRWHGVFHPYFHPISLAGRGSVQCQDWFRGILRAAKALGLPSVHAGEWLDFNDARRAVGVETLDWDGETVSLAVEGPAITGLTLMLPRWSESIEMTATVGGVEQELLELHYEGLRWWAVVFDLPEGEPVEVRLGPAG